LDGDGDGHRTAARGNADRIVTACHGDATKIISTLAGYDEATAEQAAHVLRLAGEPIQADSFSALLIRAASHVRAGFQAYVESHRENEQARTRP
jgi:hypothetical protein